MQHLARYGSLHHQDPVKSRVALPAADPPDNAVTITPRRPSAVSRVAHLATSSCG